MVEIEKTQYAEPQILASDGSQPTRLIVTVFANDIALEWTNQEATVTEWDNASVNRSRVDLRHFTQYKIVVTLTVANAGANGILGVLYSLDNSQFSNLSDGIDDTITAADAADITTATGIIASTWNDITAAAKVDNVVLAIFGNCDVNTGDPSVSKIEVHLR